MIIAIAGATGLTGRLCLELLLKEPIITSVISIGRRLTGIIHPKLSEVILNESKLSRPVVADAFISCLGTTIEKAGSTAAFEAADLYLPSYLAKEMHDQGCIIMAAVSAAGSNPSSKFLYTRTKGRMESSLSAIGFKSLSILRPSFIIGNRDGRRRGEQFSLLLLKTANPFLIGQLSKYRAVEANQIAQTLVNCIIRKTADLKVYYYDDIKKDQ